MEENYNNMVYGDQEFKTFDEIFNYGLSLCKWYKKKKAHDFFTAYVYYLYNVNIRKNVPTIEYAEQCAKNNFGYFAGYYGDDVRKKVYDYFEAFHPVFGNRYNITAKEAFYAGVQKANAREKEREKIIIEEKITAWIARDEEGGLYIHTLEPNKERDFWIGLGDNLVIDRHLFPKSNGKMKSQLK